LRPRNYTVPKSPAIQIEKRWFGYETNQRLSSYGQGQTIRCLKTILCKFLDYFYKYSVEKFYNLSILNIDYFHFIMATQGKDTGCLPHCVHHFFDWGLFL